MKCYICDSTISSATLRHYSIRFVISCPSCGKEHDVCIACNRSHYTEEQIKDGYNGKMDPFLCRGCLRDRKINKII